jgi:hypothetical protein
MRIRVVDHSRHQGLTTYQLIYEAWDVLLYMARCTIGWGYVDPWYEHNFRQAQRLKAEVDERVLFFAYHVLWPWNRDPVREVGHFLDHIEVDGQQPDALVDDLELPNTSDGWASISKADVCSQIVVQLPAIQQRSGLFTAAYTGSWWWDGHIGSCTPLGIEQDFMLIEAEYTTPRWKNGRVDFNEAPEAPQLPAKLGDGWTQDMLLAWQWTSGLRPVGVQSSSQDGQVLIPTYDELRVLLGLQAPALTTDEKVAILWEAHPELHPSN